MPNGGLQCASAIKACKNGRSHLSQKVHAKVSASGKGNSWMFENACRTFLQATTPWTSL
jgi:hypothetical protein